PAWTVPAGGRSAPWPGAGRRRAWSCPAVRGSVRAGRPGRPGGPGPPRRARAGCWPVTWWPVVRPGPPPGPRPSGRPGRRPESAPPVPLRPRVPVLSTPTRPLLFVYGYVSVSKLAPGRPRQRHASTAPAADGLRAYGLSGLPGGATPATPPAGWGFAFPKPGSHLFGEGRPRVFPYRRRTCWPDSDPWFVTRPRECAGPCWRLDSGALPGFRASCAYVPASCSAAASPVARALPRRSGHGGDENPPRGPHTGML